MARLPAAGENAAGNAVLVAGTTYYLSLHSADPGTTGASELSGGGYVRQAIVFATWASGATGNTLSITVPNAGTTAVTHVGIWSASTAGTYIQGLVMASPVTAASVVFAATTGVTPSVS
jgi:hypothetical protein